MSLYYDCFPKKMTQQTMKIRTRRRSVFERLNGQRSSLILNQ